jgi:6-phosphogluconolactonase
METRIYSDVEVLSKAALGELLQAMRVAVKQRGRFAVALAGGHTPARMYKLWADAANHGVRTQWDRVHLFWGDERYVPQDDPMSNYAMAHESLISHVPIPAANVHPMPTDLPQAQAAAEAYESDLRKFFETAPPSFDLQLLGLGVEGHTASLFPDSPALEEKERWVAAVKVPAKPPQRLTLTLPVLNQGRHTLFLVSGKDKRKIIGALRSERGPNSSQYPAGRIRPTGQVLWLLDEAAAG